MRLTIDDASPGEIREKASDLLKSLGHVLMAEGLPPDDLLHELAKSLGLEVSHADAPADGTVPHARPMAELVDKLVQWYEGEVLPSMIRQIGEIVCETAERAERATEREQQKGAAEGSIGRARGKRA